MKSGFIYFSITVLTFSLGLIVPAPLFSQIKIGKKDATGCKKKDGFILVSNGHPSYIPDLEYSLNGGPYESSGWFQDLGAGTYKVTAKYKHGPCMATETVKIGDGSDLKAFITGGGKFKFCIQDGPPNITLICTATGGTPELTYSWPNGKLEYAGSGRHTCVVTDQNGCRADTSVTIIAIPILCSRDPNDITGPIGYGEPHWVSINDRLPYLIRFENDPDFATAPAIKVVVEYVLDEDLNLFSVRLNDFGFANMVFNVPSNSTFYSNRLDVRDSLGVYVDVTAGIDVNANKVFWIFEAIDPLTGLPPTDPNIGMLPVNDLLTNRGEGFVNFSVKPKILAVTGDTVLAKAAIIFDVNETINTNEHVNIVDALPPTSHLINNLPSTLDTAVFTLNWTAVDDAGGCGIREYTLFESINDGPFQVYQSAIPDTFLVYQGTPGLKYSFFTSATDNVGNIEPSKPTGEITVAIKGVPALHITGFDRTTYCAGDSAKVTWAETGIDGVALFMSEAGITGPYTPITVALNASDSMFTWHIPANFTSCTPCFIIIRDTATASLLADTAQFNVYPLPLVDAGSDKTICKSSFTQLQATGAVAYLWSPAAFLSNAGAPNPYLSVAIATTLVYTVRGTDANGCKNIDSLIVDITPLDTTLITLFACNPAEIGTTISTLTNQAGCDSTVILHRLLDSLPPVVHTRNIPLQLDPSGHATLAPEDLDDGTSDDCSFSLALSRTDFVCADTGQQSVWLIATDALGHQDSAAATVTVLPSAACQSTIAIANTGGNTYPLPCTCAGNGNFHEEVVVSSAPGKTWVVVTTTLVNPGTSLPYPPGTPLPETPAGSGHYALAGLHAGGVGYSIEVSSPQYPGQTFTLSNTCYYPTPAITGLADLYCTGATPVTLSGSGGAGVAGTGAFTIDNNPATLFNATALGEGNHVVTYTFDAGAAGVLDPLDPGCTASVAQTVRVIYAGQPPVPCQTVVLGNITRKSATAPADSLKNAIVSLAGGSTFKDTTLVNGNYALVSGVTGNFTVTPVKNGDFVNGLSTADATRIQQHVANSQPFTDPYSRIAADVNKSNSITPVDITLISQAILGNPAALAQLSTSWRFVPKSYTFPNPSSPWGFPEKITLTGVSGVVSGQNFHAVKLGDVVTAFANPALLPGDIPPPLVWTVPDRLFEAGERWEAEFRVNNFDDIAAYQFMLKTDPAVLRLDAVLPATVLPLTHDNFGAWNSENGELRTAWSAAQGLTLPGGPVVFRLQFTALQGGGKLSDVLSLDQETLAPEAYTTKLVVTPVELSFTDPETSVSTAANGENDRLILYQNRPNPASRWTVIGFHLPDACDAVLRVSDAAGRQVALRSAYFPPGYSEVLLRLDETLPAGVYFYELVTPFGTRTRRMVWATK